MKTQFVKFTIGMLTALCAHSGNSATISLSQAPNGRNISGITIEGEIARGDFQRFVALALSTPSANNVWLASPGGDLAEAIDIGLFVRKLKMSVTAPYFRTLESVKLRSQSNNVCASACFFIYAGGVERSGAVLGIHRAFLKDADYKKMSMDDAARSYAAGQVAVRDYLDHMGVPRDITDHMAATPPDKVEWLNKDDVDRISGFIPEYQEWVTARCGKMTPQDLSTLDNGRNKLNRGEKLNSTDEAYIEAFAEKSQSRVDCKRDLLTQEQERIRTAMVKQIAENNAQTGNRKH